MTVRPFSFLLSCSALLTVPGTTEASSTAVDELLEEASTYQDGVIAKRRAVEEEERAKLQRACYSSPIRRRSTNFTSI